MTADHDDSWSTLRFEEAVLNEFRFLVTEYGFTQRRSSPSCVSYERDDVRVAIQQDRSSFELRVSVERRATGERFSVWEIARLQNAPGVDENTSAQASTKDQVQRLIAELGMLLRTYGHGVLCGDEGFFSRLRQLQQDESNQFLREGRLRWVRERLPEMWRQRNYAEIVRLLDDVREQLSASELAKLSYARHRLK